MAQLMLCSNQLLLSNGQSLLFSDLALLFSTLAPQVDVFLSVLNALLHPSSSGQEYRMVLHIRALVTNSQFPPLINKLQMLKPRLMLLNVLLPFTNIVEYITALQTTVPVFKPQPKPQPLSTRLPSPKAHLPLLSTQLITSAAAMRSSTSGNKHTAWSDSATADSTPFMKELIPLVYMWE